MKYAVLFVFFVFWVFQGSNGTIMEILMRKLTVANNASACGTDESLFIVTIVIKHNREEAGKKYHIFPMDSFQIPFLVDSLSWTSVQLFKKKTKYTTVLQPLTAERVLGRNDICMEVHGHDKKPTVKDLVCETRTSPP